MYVATSSNYNLYGRLLLTVGYVWRRSQNLQPWCVVSYRAQLLSSVCDEWSEFACRRLSPMTVMTVLFFLSVRRGC
jgi:hypothetical protein